MSDNYISIPELARRLGVTGAMGYRYVKDHNLPLVADPKNPKHSLISEIYIDKLAEKIASEKMWIKRRMKLNSLSQGDDPLYTVPEAANYLGLSQITVRKMADNGTFPYVRLSNRILFRKSTLDDVGKNIGVESGKFITQAAMARECGLSRERIRQLIQSGAIPSVEFNKKRVVPRATWEEFMASSVDGARPWQQGRAFATVEQSETLSQARTALIELGVPLKENQEQYSSINYLNDLKRIAKHLSER